MSHSIGRRDFLAAGSRAAFAFSFLPGIARAERLQASQWKPLVVELEKLITRLLEEANVPGLGIAIFSAGQAIWRRGFGVRDRSTKAPIDNDTVFEAASMSKPPFAYVVMKLCEKGVLALDTPLTKYTSERFLKDDTRLDLITARQVLSHTSGFQNWRSDKEPLTIHFAPGERYMYSGEGYSYLQSAVTGLTGQPIDAYMKAQMFVPFAMASSDFFLTERLRRHAARPHDRDGVPADFKLPTPESIARYGAAGGLLTTPSDYAKFMIEVVDPKPTDAFRLTKGSLDEMLRPHVKTNDAFASSWALGWQVQQDGVINHGGHNFGFQSHAVASVKSKSGFVIMTNGENGSQVIDKLLRGDLMRRFL